jgi:hypothetical protein
LLKSYIDIVRNQTDLFEWKQSNWIKFETDLIWIKRNTDLILIELEPDLIWIIFKTKIQAWLKWI